MSDQNDVPTPAPFVPLPIPAELSAAMAILRERTGANLATAIRAGKMRLVEWSPAGRKVYGRETPLTEWADISTHVDTVLYMVDYGWPAPEAGPELTGWEEHVRDMADPTAVAWERYGDEVEAIRRSELAEAEMLAEREAARLGMSLEEYDSHAEAELERGRRERWAARADSRRDPEDGLPF